jgi:periplasmic divalent cation tolerance protein
MSSIAIVLVTAPSQQEAEHLAAAMVEERLAACGNIVPGIVSIYRWQGAVQRESEVLLMFKTSAALAPRLMERVQQLHPYEVPEAVALHSADVLPSYAAWVTNSTSA